MGSLDGRVAVVTGAGRGIGREEARYLAGQGAAVVVNDPGVAPDGGGGDSSVARQVADEIVAAGGRAVANTDSVADWSGAARVVATAVRAFGDLHVVINNAGIERGGALGRLSEAAFDDVVAVKLKGTFAISHWAATYFREQHAAGARADRSIINTASGSGLLNPLPTQTNYAAANAGVAAMTTVHALELGVLGVRVNCLSPSMIRTRLTAAVPGMPTAPATPGAFDPNHPAVIAPVAAYLAAADCPLTGQVLSVRATAVTINRGWSAGETISSGAEPWTVDRLAIAARELTVTDPYEDLAASLSGALGPMDTAQVRALVAAQVV
ncbi:SDR family NAD(P)-dependent oxidoreductase [Occultella aeris]|uniref:Short-chain type dehydrogenase/reductase n=1 Tax=Occultella aeris TaxID=2761496 RepID=A0A7M4DIT8_9MICO|nr:SDR family NAD(P)-dependent oxidoreductase [Occultella aeris]VZO36901.1 Putative short-chain type dehydrogenase/reductase [Occultella aeris]